MATSKDESLARDVRKGLDADPELDPLAIDAEVRGGTVRLTGEVGSFAERLRATSISAKTPGVTAVDNELTVRPYGSGWRTTDVEIAEAIAQALDASGFATSKLGVEVSNHVVILTGHLPTAADRAAVRHSIQSVPDVNFIDNRIMVRPERSSPQEPSRALDEAECWQHLLATQIGRLAIRTDSGVDIFPVNYLVYDEALYFRSAPGTKLEDLTNQPSIAFEIDGHRGRTMWSVVVHGTATRMDMDDDIHASGVLNLEGFHPGEKFNFVKITPTAISGRTFSK